jgi:DNA-binding beta-propeller fold protein YncE
VQELDGTVTVLAYANGHLKKMQETTVDRKPGTVNRAADIHLSPDGRFLYATNRGSANNISCFAVDKVGKLSFVQQISTQGDGPRNFAITPDGKYILVGHQFTNNIVVFKRDAKTGKLSPAGINYEICGSNPDPDAVIISAGISSLFIVGFSCRNFSISSLILFSNLGLLDAKFSLPDDGKTCPLLSFSFWLSFPAVCLHL